MKTSSAKNKGRRLQQYIRDKLLEWAPDLKPDDIRSASMGSGGEDILFSPAAREVYPISIESKNCEKASPWEWYRQAQENSNGHIPVVIFSRNRSEAMVMLSFEDWLRLVR